MGSKNRITILLGVVVLLFAVVNLVLVFVPEIGFDALWYHLTLPKLWLSNKQYYFSGGLLYYSVMPRLTEFIFTPLIYFTGTVGPKFVQYLSGLLTCYFIYKIGHQIQIKKYYLWLGISLFYCTWLVSWESSSAYIDLFRALLEVIALYLIIKKSYLMGGVFIGLAVGTKWLSLISLFIYVFVFGLQILPTALIVSAPWFFIAYHYTKNPVYPLFSGVLENGFQSISQAIKNLLFAPFHLTIPFDDFISPYLGILFIICVLVLVYQKGDIKKIATIGFLGSVSTLLLDPPSARFLLPYLPAIIISALFLVQKYLSKQSLTIGYLCLISAFGIFSLRMVAAKKYIPYILGIQTQTQFLTSLESRLPDTFIDTDNYVKDQIPENSKILIDQLHNLYYFPHKFDHTSWANNNLKYDYLITKNQDPKQVMGQLIHTNQIGIQYFKLND